MYVYLGGDVSVLSQQLIVVLDAEAAHKSKETRRFLEQAAARGAYRDVSGGTISSYVVAGAYVYASSIAASTLKKRLESGLIEGPGGLTVPGESA